MSVRRRALEALLDITEKGAYANLRLKEAEAGLAPQDAKWLSAAVYETLDRLMMIDYILKAYAKGKLDKTVRGVLRLGVCQALYLNVPHSAACNESVKLAKEVGKGALSGYVNGVMRAVCNACANANGLPPLPQDPVERLSIAYSRPKWLVEEYTAAYGLAMTEAIFSGGERAFTIRPQYPYTADALARALEEKGLAYDRGALAKEAFRLKKGFDVTAEPLFADGSITVQSESAMAVCEILAPEKGARVLDACCAPGGKTAYLSHLMGGTGEIEGWELHPHRVELTERTLARLRVNNARVCVKDAGEYDPAYHEAFDSVLADAPCSGLGVWGKPDARYAKSPAVIGELEAVQRRILDACARYVKPGGALVYATCTISPRENEGVAEWFRITHKEFEPCDFTPLLPQAFAGRVKNGAVQLFPHLDGTEGFFIAKFTKRKGNPC